jgi:hypothetical protein
MSLKLKNSDTFTHPKLIQLLMRDGNEFAPYALRTSSDQDAATS